MANDEEIQQKVVNVPMEAFIPEGMPLVYCNQSAIVHTQEEFFLYFFQAAIPPIPPGTKPEDIKTYKAYCVAQIVLSSEHMERFVEHANKQLAGQKRAKKGKAK